MKNYQTIRLVITRLSWLRHWHLRKLLGLLLKWGCPRSFGKRLAGGYQFVFGHNQVLKQITNLEKDIRNLLNGLRDIEFICYNGIVNRLAMDLQTNKGISYVYSKFHCKKKF